LLSPHSLGKSVEWKHLRLTSQWFYGGEVPTRWGNQLNGNF